MNLKKVVMMLGLGMGVALWAGNLVGRSAIAQSPSSQAPRRSFQRSEEIYNFATAATSGSQRGQEIYYFKCWMCHNDYTIKAGTPAPSLKDL
ncbi:hypothetical protein MYX82_13445, partial [Acidobacteria bacterium AH-259-D05]|nr:hypothetical protein [Acidobacteria bacterium AH-259-D05]